MTQFLKDTILVTRRKGDISMSDSSARHSKEVISEYWDKRSESYAKSDSIFKDEERAIWKKCLIPAIADMSIRKALDVGIGPGFLSFILHDMEIDVMGLDMSRCMLNQAKDTSCYQRLNLDLCQGDAESLPFQSSSFDLVVSRNLLWTLPEPDKALIEWKRVLKPGGKILAFDGNHFDPSAVKKMTRWISVQLSRLSHDRNPVPFRKFYKPIEKHLPLYAVSGTDQYRAIFKVAGLECVTVDYLPEVNRFYREHRNLLFQLANADTVFLVKGKKSNDI
jgi:ubiquinone/menaquinone biosynthesis C-methylase UbiE